MTADGLIKLLAAPDVERVELRPDGTVIVVKRAPFHVCVPCAPIVRPWWEVSPYVHPETTWISFADGIGWDGVNYTASNGACGNVAIGGES
jgi:hypothetical protein